MARRTGVLELSVLGLLADTPMHGYELRKRLGAVLGAFRAFSYGLAVRASSADKDDGSSEHNEEGEQKFSRVHI